jgi:hypothetical protein
VDKAWRWFLPGYLMLLPMTIIGLLQCLIVYRAASWRWSGGCIECVGGERIWGKPGAQTPGLVITYRDENARSSGGLRVHERVHVVQGMIGGPLFALGYGLSFLWFWAASGFAHWHIAYMKIPFEVRAYARQDAWLAADETTRAKAWQ